MAEVSPTRRWGRGGEGRAALEHCPQEARGSSRADESFVSLTGALVPSKGPPMPLGLFEAPTRERGVDPSSPEGGESGKVLERERLGSNALLPKALSGPEPSTAARFGS